MILEQQIDEAVRLTGSYSSLDVVELDRLRGRLLDLADAASAEPLLLDLGGVEEIGARFVGLLATVAIRLQKRGRRLAICNVSPEVQEIIFLARLDRILEVRENHPDSFSIA